MPRPVSPLAHSASPSEFTAAVTVFCDTLTARLMGPPMGMAPESAAREARWQFMAIMWASAMTKRRKEAP